MKRLFLLFLIAIFAIGSTNAEINSSAKKQIMERMNNLKEKDFIEYHKQKQKIKPNLEVQNMISNGKSILKKNENKIQAGETMSMPNDARFPAEFEEIQAVLIAWPYYSFEASGTSQDFYEPLFEGKGIYFNSLTQEVSLIDIVSIPDVYAESPYSKIQSELAYAIQQEVPVWINIWAAEDSTEIKDFMTSIGKPLTNYRFFVNPGNSFWYRDCGPVGFYYGENDDLAFLDFEYYGGRPLDDLIPIKVANEIGVPVYTTTVEFEGGNILVDGDGRLLTTTAVSQLNADGEGKYYLDAESPFGFSVEEKPIMSMDALKDSLKYLMNLKDIRIFNKLINDGGTGHIDLYADLYDENTFVFTKYPDALSSHTDATIGKRNIDTMLSITSRNGAKYNSRSIPLPKKNNGSWYSSQSDYAKYTRTYSNHLFVNKTIIQPVFYTEGAGGDKASHDEAMIALRKAYPGYKFANIDVRSFDGSGGAIHCITKQIPADNPIRIWHKPVELNDRTELGFPFYADIKNKSGIEVAKVYWRKKGETLWNEMNLEAQANNMFYGLLPNEGLSEDDVIEYYISARSNNGKAINKPIVAPDGLYEFSLKMVSVNEDYIADEAGEFFPNPANEFSSLELNLQNNSKVNLEIIDVSGSVVYQRILDIVPGYDVITLNTSILNSGIYYVSIKSEDGKMLMRKLNVVR